MDISEEIRGKIVSHQRNEISEYHIYRRLAGKVGNPENRHILEKIAQDELRHYTKLIALTGSVSWALTSSPHLLHPVGPRSKSLNPK
jgi:nitrogenase subunit NifH